MAQPIIEAKGIFKQFGHVAALRGADFSVFPNEIVALVGDNGAGKSTLVKVMAGVYRPDAGNLYFQGAPVTFGSPIDARLMGIETVYQDLALAAEIDPVANMFLGREKLRPGILGRLGFLDNRTMRAESEQAFRSLGIRISDTHAPVANMSGGQRQAIAISRAVTWASKIAFLDEPTAALGVVQTRIVLQQIKRIKELGVSVVLISHNMPQVFEVADRIYVLRLGKCVAQLKRAETTMDDVVAAMTGARSFLEVSES